MLFKSLSWDADYYYEKLNKQLDKESKETLDSLIKQVMEDAKDELNNTDAYQEFAAKAIRPESEGKNLIVGFALGLGGEAGEVIDDIKKREYHGRDIPIKHTAEELGDLLWYASNIASQLGYKLSDIMDMNKNKLINRYKDLYKEEK